MEIDPSCRDAADLLAEAQDCDVLWLSGPIDIESQIQLSSALQERKIKKKELCYLLCTPGGSADVAYKIARLFQNSYETVTALISGWCKSAGTLCVIGANHLVMTDRAELGPLDVQISKRDEIGERDSGLVVSEALRTLEAHVLSLFRNCTLQIKEESEGAASLKMVAEVSALLAKGVFEPVYRQVDPEKLVSTMRSLGVAEAYGKRLNIKAKNLQDGAIAALTYGYPSHSFVIDKREAEGLFHSLRGPTPTEIALLAALGQFALIPQEGFMVKFLNKHVNNKQTVGGCV